MLGAVRAKGWSLKEQRETLRSNSMQIAKHHKPPTSQAQHSDLSIWSLSNQNEVWLLTYLIKNNTSPSHWLNRKHLWAFKHISAVTKLCKAPNYTLGLRWACDSWLNSKGIKIYLDSYLLTKCNLRSPWQPLPKTVWVLQEICNLVCKPLKTQLCGNTPALHIHPLGNTATGGETQQLPKWSAPLHLSLESHFKKSLQCEFCGVFSPLR